MPGVNGDAHWAHLRPQRWVSSTGGIHPEGKVRYARSIITASPSENWRRSPGRPRTTWMKTIQQDLRSNNLSLDEAITVAQNRPLRRLMSAFGAMHP